MKTQNRNTNKIEIAKNPKNAKFKKTATPKNT